MALHIWNDNLSAVNYYDINLHQIKILLMQVMKCVRNWYIYSWSPEDDLQ